LNLKDGVPLNLRIKNFRGSMLKEGLPIDTTFNLLLFSSDSTFKMLNMFYASIGVVSCDSFPLKYKINTGGKITFQYRSFESTPFNFVRLRMESI
jgi:hypothetical protein